MDVRHFHQEHQCVWEPPSAEYQWAFDAAIAYYRNTEEYDRTVCTGQVFKGSIRPATARELSLVNTNAKNLMRSLIAEAQKRGVADDVWRDAFRIAGEHYRKSLADECDPEGGSGGFSLAAGAEKGV